MKQIIFVRGDNGVEKRNIVQNLMDILNPDVNHVTAIKLAMNDYIPIKRSVKEDQKDLEKSAAKTVTNIFKKVLSMNEDFIVIDNPSLAPMHWRNFKTIAENMNINIRLIGINVPSGTKGDQMFEAEMSSCYVVSDDYSRENLFNFITNNTKAFFENISDDEQERIIGNPDNRIMDKNTIGNPNRR